MAEEEDAAAPQSAVRRVLSSSGGGCLRLPMQEGETPKLQEEQVAKEAVAGQVRPTFPSPTRQSHV